VEIVITHTGLSDISIDSGCDFAIGFSKDVFTFESGDEADVAGDFAFVVVI
jgi:hypothetical protein